MSKVYPYQAPTTQSLKLGAGIKPELQKSFLRGVVQQKVIQMPVSDA